MAANVQFYDKTTNEAVDLTIVDERVCELLGEPVHPINYCHGWFDVVGLFLALDYRDDALNKVLAETYEKDEDMVRRDRMVTIAEFLQQTYNVQSWSTVGRR